MKQLLIPLCLAALATGCSASDTKIQEADPASSVASVTTNISFDAVETNLRQALKKRDLKLFTVVDHGEGAKSVDMNIGQSKLFIFGNPKSGTPLMKANREMGLELPMKILIYSDGPDQVVLRYTDIKKLARQYNLTDQDGRLDKIETTLNTISKEALSK